MTLSQYKNLLSSIGVLLQRAKNQSYIQVNAILVKTYREIGRYIVEYEQKGKEKAEYGSNLFERLSKDLKEKYGKGFSRSNLYLIRLFFIKYPIFQALPGKLTRTHYAELLIIENDLERSFYEKQAINENWSTREIKRQIKIGLYYRLIVSNNKKGKTGLAKKGINIQKTTDIGQMNMYLNYFKKEEMTVGDSEPIGIVLAKDKESAIVEYALGGITNQLFVSKYQLHLPNKKDLQDKFNDLVEGF